VVRISGPATRAVLGAVAGGVPRARRASLRMLVGDDGQPIDGRWCSGFPRRPATPSRTAPSSTCTAGRPS
jgi:hypothetical protein